MSNSTGCSGHELCIVGNDAHFIAFTRQFITDNDRLLSIIKAFFIAVSCGLFIAIVNFYAFPSHSTRDVAIVLSIGTGFLGAALLGWTAYRDSVRALAWERFHHTYREQLVSLVDDTCYRNGRSM